MQSLLEKPNRLIEEYEQVKGVLATYGPSWLDELRSNAMRSFRQRGFPTAKDEEFKYTSLRALEEGGFGPAYGETLTRAEIEAAAVGKVDAYTLAFVNGQHAPELCSPRSLPEGVFVGSLQDAFAEHAHIIERHLGKIASFAGRLGSTNDPRFIDLNTAYLGEGAFVYIPRGVAVEPTVHLLFASKAAHGPFASHPRVLIVAEENAQAKIMESYVGLGGVYFTNAVTELWIASGAVVEHTKFQQESPDAIHIATVQADQEGGSTWTQNNASFGARIARNDINVYVHGEHCETSLNGAYVGTGEQVVDNHTRIDHAMPNCHSFEIYKGILGGRAVGVFNGKIFVYQDAQKTDAKQSNQAILLSPTATINTKPQLEIFADDVKCTHGATVGQLREDAMFYLRQRGIPRKEAQALLVYAFAAEVLEKISVEDIGLTLERVLYDKLNETESLPEA